MSTKDCVLCGRPVEDCIVEEIQPTICCKECCENCSYSSRGRICSTSDALSGFRCRRVDLLQLHSNYRLDACSRRLYRTRFYLKAEAKHLGEIATALRQQKATLKRQRDEDDRLVKRQRLETRHRVVVHEIRPILRPFILGDYLKFPKSKTLLRDVKQRYFLKDRASELMDSCKAHPLSAMAFCSDHPNGTTETYLELKENMRKVFSIEGNRLMQMLSPIDKERLKGTVLEDLLVWSQIPRHRMKLFLKLEEEVGAIAAGKIISHPACEQRIERGGNVDQVAEKLLAFWNSRNNTLQRKLELDNALKTHGVKIKRKAKLCRDYIGGAIDVDLDEMVGSLDVDRRLKCICQGGWENYFASSQAVFRHCFVNQKLSLKESVDIAMKKTEEQIDKRKALQQRFHKCALEKKR